MVVNDKEISLKMKNRLVKYRKRYKMWNKKCYKQKLMFSTI